MRRPKKTLFSRVQIPLQIGILFYPFFHFSLHLGMNMKFWNHSLPNRISTHLSKISYIPFQLNRNKFNIYFSFRCALEFAKKDVQPRMYAYKDLQKATSNFHDNMKLGQGAFGAVYKVFTKHSSHQITCYKSCYQFFQLNYVSYWWSFNSNLKMAEKWFFGGWFDVYRVC
jgi:hypothetical protein